MEEKIMTEIGARALDVATVTTITTREQYDHAAGVLREIKEYKREVAEQCDPVVASAYAAHKEATAMRARFLKPIEEAERIIRDRCGEYLTRERKAEDERRAAEDMARAAAIREADEKKLAAAIEAEAAGNAGAAEAIMAAPTVFRAPEKAAPVETVKGQATKWTAAVVDPRAVLSAIIAGRVPLDVVVFSPGALADHAKASGVEGVVDGIKRDRVQIVRV